MINNSKHIINHQQSLGTALQMLNELGEDLTLFVVDDNNRLIGTLTDGDSRRGLLKGLGVNDSIKLFMEPNFRYVESENYQVNEILNAKRIGIKLLPVLDKDKRIVRILNFSHQKSLLPISAAIMAGGEGIRMRPLTENVPKPLLKIGDKPILDYVMDCMTSYGITDFKIVVNYLGNKIKEYLGDGSSKGISITYLEETTKLGTIGGLSLMDKPTHENILIMNSDLLTNIDLEEFFLHHQSNDADISVACIPYTVNIPYAILETNETNILGFKEKPSLTFHSNAGIYLLRREHLNLIPKGSFFNATDLIEMLIESKKKVVYYPILGYWLDIGKMDDYAKAQADIKYIKF